MIFPLNKTYHILSELDGCPALDLNWMTSIDKAVEELYCANFTPYALAPRTLDEENSWHWLGEAAF